MGDKVGAEDKSKIDEALADLKRTLESGDVAAIKEKTETLKQASYQIAEEMYKNAGAQGGAAGAAGPEGAQTSDSGDNTKTAEDVDYEVVDDDKK
jgi:molecular chaperone DnaK